MLDLINWNFVCFQFNSIPFIDKYLRCKTLNSKMFN